MNAVKRFLWNGIIFVLALPLYAMQNNQEDDISNLEKSVRNLNLDSKKHSELICVCNDTSYNMQATEENKCFACWMHYFNNFFYPSNYGITPLHVAVDYNHEFIITTLIAQNASINAFDYEGRTPLHYKIAKLTFFCSLTLQIEKNVINLLLEHGATVNHRDNKKRTILHLMIFKFDESIVNLLIEHKACINHVDGNHQTMMHYAVSYLPEVRYSRHEKLPGILLHYTSSTPSRIIKYLLSLPFTWAEEIYDPKKFVMASAQLVFQDSCFYKKAKRLLLIFKALKNAKIIDIPKGVRYMIIAFCFDPKEYLKSLVGMEDSQGLTPYQWSVKKELTEITKMLEPYR